MSNKLTQKELCPNCTHMVEVMTFIAKACPQCKIIMPQKSMVTKEDIRSVLWEHFFKDGRKFLKLFNDCQYQETMNEVVDEESEILSKKFAEKFKELGMKIGYLE